MEFSSVLRESDVFLEPIHLPESELFDVGKGSRDQNTHAIHKRKSMAILLAILDFLFGCHHAHLSRVFTLQGETYRVCCDCGGKFAYSLKTMSIEHRLPLPEQSRSPQFGFLDLEARLHLGPASLLRGSHDYRTQRRRHSIAAYGPSPTGAGTLELCGYVRSSPETIQTGDQIHAPR